ncbi:MAG: 50S ribosomal protein L35 [Planctomycetota bacterium]|nr:50S ribosomal protein L35 [Planctomycetota bacterium]
MPKQKGHKGLTKRLKVTATGKLKHRRPGSRHLMSSKNAKRRRKISRPTIMTGTMAKRVKTKLCI